MQRRLKVTLACALLAVGFIAAFVCRKSPIPTPVEPPTADEVLATRGATAPQPSPSATAEPAAMHLLGRIEPADRSQPNATPEETLENETPPVASANPQTAAAPVSEGFAKNQPRSDKWHPSSWQHRPPREASTLDEATSAPTAEPQAATLVIYKIRDGDTLAELARAYLGNTNRFLEIYQANRNVLSSPDLLPIGVEIKIRVTQRGQPTGSVSQTDPDAENMVSIRPGSRWRSAGSRPATRIYQVRGQESLADLARQFYGDSGRAEEIYQANRDRLNRPEDLRDGMSLVIP